MSEQHADYVYKSDCTLRVGRWALDPCWRCGRQPEKDEVIALDWMAQTVLCGVCRKDDMRKLAEALDRNIRRHIDGSEGGAV